MFQFFDFPISGVATVQDDIAGGTDNATGDLQGDRFAPLYPVLPHFRQNRRGRKLKPIFWQVVGPELRDRIVRYPQCENIKFGIEQRWIMDDVLQKCNFHTDPCVQDRRAHFVPSTWIERCPCSAQIRCMLAVRYTVYDHFLTIYAVLDTPQYILHLGDTPGHFKKFLRFQTSQGRIGQLQPLEEIVLALKNFDSVQK